MEEHTSNAHFEAQKDITAMVGWMGQEEALCVCFSSKTQAKRNTKFEPLGFFVWTNFVWTIFLGSFLSDLGFNMI